MAETKIEEDEQVVRPFADFMRELARGRVHEELSEQLHELLAAVRDTAKPGTLTLTLKVNPVRGSERQIMIADKVEAKLPKPDQAPTLWFIDNNGNPSREDPQQMRFETMQAVKEGSADKPQEPKFKEA